MDRVEVQCHAAVRAQLKAGQKSSGHDVTEVKNHQLEVQCHAAVKVQL